MEHQKLPPVASEFGRLEDLALALERQGDFAGAIRAWLDAADIARNSNASDGLQRCLDMARVLGRVDAAARPRVQRPQLRPDCLIALVGDANVTAVVASVMVGHLYFIPASMQSPAREAAAMLLETLPAGSFGPDDHMHLATKISNAWHATVPLAAILRVRRLWDDALDAFNPAEPVRNAHARVVITDVPEDPNTSQRLRNLGAILVHAAFAGVPARKAGRPARPLPPCDGTITLRASACPASDRPATVPTMTGFAMAQDIEQQLVHGFPTLVTPTQEEQGAAPARAA